MASEAVAQVMFLLLGGVLADRFSRYRLMVGSDLLACAAQGSIAGLFISGAAPLSLVAALAAVTGAASGIFYPGLTRPDPANRRQPAVAVRETR